MPRGPVSSPAFRQQAIQPAPDFALNRSRPVEAHVPLVLIPLLLVQPVTCLRDVMPGTRFYAAKK